MVQINFAQKQVNAKIVYYGPGMSGKTTNLEVIHQRAPEGNRGDLTSISTEGDRTLFFDFMPLDLGTVAGMRTCFQIYTVPGQVYYNSTRKLVLQGVDGVIFVADSSPNMMEENLESLRNLEENLREYGRSLADTPLVIQYNKRDMPGALSIDELEEQLNHLGAPAFEAIANTGQGVFPTLKAVAAAVLDSLHRQQGGGVSSPVPAPAGTAPTGPDSAPVAAEVAPAASPLPTPPAAAPSEPALSASGSLPPAPERRTISMSQTGFHRAASVPLEQAAQASAPAPPPSSTPEGGGLRLAGAGTAPAPQAAASSVTPPPAPEGGLQLQRPQPAAMPAPAPTAQAVATQPAPPQAPAEPGPAALMGGVEASARPQPRRVPASRTFPTTPPSQEPRPTPRKGRGRGVVVAGLIVVASVGIGAVLGGVLLKFL
jgi:signal recognition particle receptor subunit beta